MPAPSHVLNPISDPDLGNRCQVVKHYTIFGMGNDCGNESYRPDTAVHILQRSSIYSHWKYNIKMSHHLTIRTCVWGTGGEGGGRKTWCKTCLIPTFAANTLWGRVRSFLSSPHTLYQLMFHYGNIIHQVDTNSHRLQTPSSWEIHFPQTALTESVSYIFVGMSLFIMSSY